MNPKVSILVPVYNVSPFIERCAASLFNQTLEDIEYIFVNDATPDDSIEKLQKVIDNYPERKDSIKIIHHSSNLGLAESRNSALESSSGSYIAVVDSDDFIEPDMMEVLYNKAMFEKADIVVCDIIIEFQTRSRIAVDYISGNKEENFKNVIKHDLISSSLCNKLVKRNLYLQEDCRVPENLNYCEDCHVTTRIFYFATNIVKVDQPFYHYVQSNTNAITKTINRMHFENVLRFWKLLDAFLLEHNLYDKYKPIMALPKTQSKVHLLIDTHSSQLRKEFAGMFLEEEKQCIYQFTKGERLMLYLVRYRLFFFAQLFHKYLVLKYALKRKLSM